MSYKTLVSMNIAVIGNSEIGALYAAGFAQAGHSIFLASSKVNDAIKISGLDNVCICNISDAAAVADLIIFATAPKEVREAAYWLGDVRRKVIIDATANVHAPNEELVKTGCAIRAITGSPHVVKIFNTKGYEQMLRPLFCGQEVDMLMAGDSKKAKAIAKIMAVEMGQSHFYDFGGNDTIPLFNEMTRCWRNMLTPKKSTELRVIH